MNPGSNPVRHPVITFIGTTPNIGTTAVSFTTAVHVAKRIKGKVGYLCLNLKSSKLHRYLGKEAPAHTLDGLRAELKAGFLDRTGLLQRCEILAGMPTLHVLYGNMLREQAEFYTPEDIRHLIRAARDAFDLTIIEVNAYWDNAATVCGMLEADERMVVTTPDAGHFSEDAEKGLMTMFSLFSIPAESCSLVVTQVDPGVIDQASIREIERTTGWKTVAVVKRDAGWQTAMNQGRLADYIARNDKVKREMTPLADRLVRRHGLEETEPIRAGMRPWRWLPGLGRL